MSEVLVQALRLNSVFVCRKHNSDFPLSLLRYCFQCFCLGAFDCHTRLPMYSLNLSSCHFYYFFFCKKGVLVGQDIKHVPAYVSGIKNITDAWCQKMLYASSIKGTRSQNFLCSDLHLNYLSCFQFSGCFLANFSFLQLSLKYIAFPK